MTKKIILITGGERSGKSSFAELMAQKMDHNPIYLATARVWDDEFQLRIDKHRERRGPHWINVEEQMFLSKHKVTGHTVLVDCLTLWATNWFFEAHQQQTNSPTDDNQAMSAQAAQKHVQQVLDKLKEEFTCFTQQEATFIFVTNEIGSGGISPHPVQRQFTDLLGWLNQFVAQAADEVYLLVSGIPVKIK